MKFINSFVLLFLMINLSFGQSKIERVEPPNWWTGMQHNQIQLLVHGDQIANLNPVIKYDHVSLDRIIKVPNPNYLFLNITIGQTVKPRDVIIDFYKNGKVVLSHSYPLLKREAGRDQLQGFDPSDAIYLITPDRFANGDPSNDNVEGMREKVNRSNKGGRHGGDIAGMRQHLDYIKNLGFTAIWLNPLLENDMQEYSYHGYSTTDFYKVDSRFGSNEEYKALADETREKGMKMIMDMIVNHCGSEHWWMKDLPVNDWINQWDTYTQTNHQKSTVQDPYASAIDKKTFTDGWFVPTMPDLNQNNELMAKYLIQNSIWWVEYLGLAGIRMDTYPYPDMDYMTEWTEAMMKEYPKLNIVGEEWHGNPAIVSYWQKGKTNSNGYTSDLKSLMDFPTQEALVKSLNGKDGFQSSWNNVYEMLAFDFLYADPMNLVIFPDNHDMKRFLAQVGGDINKFKKGLVFVLTMRGIPQIYYGTEILMDGQNDGDHGMIRSDFPGGWAGDAVNGFTGKGLSEQQKEVKNYLSKLLKWRQTATAIHNGKLMHFLPENGIYVYFRYNGDQKVMVILNKNKEATQLKLKRFREILGGIKKGVDVISRKEFLIKDAIVIPAASATVLDLK